MELSDLRIMLADDDADDCLFFREALEESGLTNELVIVNDGVELMSQLNFAEFKLPDVLYLDLNMPRKNGFECLSEIKLNSKLRHIPVIIFSTSFDNEVVTSLHEKSAHFYMRKPGEFANLKKIIFKSLKQILENNQTQPDYENFVLQP